MAVPLRDLRPSFISSTYQKQKNNSTTIHRRTSLCFTSKINHLRHFSSPLHSPSNRRQLGYISPTNSAAVNGVQIESNPEDSPVCFTFLEELRNWFAFLRAVLPGGSWWDFSEEVEIEAAAKPVTVLRALHRMWGLVAHDRWVIFIAFASLIVTALSEIAIPHFLTASIFSAQSGQVSVFQGNVRLLVIVCLTAGIGSGIRHCCFAITNMILVKRMRETLYSSLLYQDISFFDGETVGDLTSRLGADCQQVSRLFVIDVNFMLRNGLKGAGALIYLLILSWPLGLCTLAICTTLSTIMLVYGQYQKKTAKLTQEFAASANEAAQETLSLMRTVRFD